MKGLVVLCLGLLALADASQSPIQQQAVDILLDFFHSRNLVRSVFKEQAVTDVVEEVLNMGTFVQLQVELAQTHCRKPQRRTHSCHIKAGGRRQTCLACIKFDSADPESVLDRSLHCLSNQSPVFQEVKRRHNQECENVKNAQEDRYLPGRFAFSKGQPS